MISTVVRRILSLDECRDREFLRFSTRCLRRKPDFLLGARFMLRHAGRKYSLKCAEDPLSVVHPSRHHTADVLPPSSVVRQRRVRLPLTTALAHPSSCCGTHKSSRTYGASCRRSESAFARVDAPDRLTAKVVATGKSAWPAPRAGTEQCLLALQGCRVL